MGAESARSDNGTDQPREWYVLAGIKGKTLDAAYVKSLFDGNRVKIRGPYTRDEILRYHRNRMIAYDTILYRDGDTMWRPLERQELPTGRGVAEYIRIPGVDRDRLSTLLSLLTGYARANRIVMAALAVAALLGYLAHDYYYYKPERIYDRIKRSVVMITSENAFGQKTSLGSGFVIGKEGIIATNLHVISGSTGVRIKSGDHLTYDAEGVVFIDEKNDLALLRIRKKDGKDTLDSIAMGKPEDIKVGERVYAVGNPAGMEFTLSEGIVSGKRGQDPVSKEARELIQITAPISPGNSGGPVLDNRGHVVGVATLGSRNELQNLNFAVPVNVFGDPSSHREIEYRFLPANPKWTPINLNLNYSRQAEGNPYATVNDTVSNYYNRESLTVHGDTRRVWVRAQISSRSSYRDPYGGLGLDNRRLDVVGLVEINCRQKAFRFNILIGRGDDEVPAFKSNFSEKNRWKNLDGQGTTVLDKVCDNG